MKTEEIEKAAIIYDRELKKHPVSSEALREDLAKFGQIVNKHWQEKTKSNLVQLFSDTEFIENLCFSYRHDFGLLGVEKQIFIRLECKEWLRAIINNWKEAEL